MALNSKTIQRITGTNSMADVQHSTAYAHAQGSGASSIGADSFAKRQEIEKNRVHIKGYGDSKLIRDNGMQLRAKIQENRDASAAAAAAASAAVEAAGGSTGLSGRQEMGIRAEKGGLRRFDTRNQANGKVGQYGGHGAQNSTQSSQQGYSRQNAAAIRQARADRFAGTARPVPKTGGFGRH